MIEDNQQHEDATQLAEDLSGDSLSEEGAQLAEDLNGDSLSEEAAQTADGLSGDPQRGEAAQPAEALSGDSLSDEEFDAQFGEQALDEILAEDQSIEDEFLASGDEDEAAERIRIIASEPLSEPAMGQETEASEDSSDASDVSDAGDVEIRATHDELKPAIESLLFVADEPLPFKHLCKILGDIPEEDVMWALSELVADYDSRGSGLEVRQIAGGWRISTRPQNHEFIRKYLKSRPSARLSLPALETLAVIAYKQPITIPEILEIRGVTSSSAVKTLLEKRLIVTKGRKETVGRPMMYGTSKEFLIHFGLRDLTELPSIEDFEDFAQ
jgi:segregation and condensation protein B